MASVTPKVRRQVWDRAKDRCEMCCRPLQGAPQTSVHHRTPRGMGGSRNPDLGLAGNLLLLCGSGTTGCHGWVETHRAAAMDRGLLVPRIADPAATPFQDNFGRLWLLDNTGRKEPYRDTVD